MNISLMNNVFVISLAEASERREKFSLINSHVDFEFIDAVIGKNLDSNVLQNRSFFSEDLKYSLGAYGNALSHLTLWKLCIEKECPITIAEDDCYFRKDFHEKLNETINQLSNDWDIIHWGWNFDSIVSLNILKNVSNFLLVTNQDQLRSRVDNFRNSTDRPIAIPLAHSCGLPCYTLTPQGAEKLISNCFPLSNFDTNTGSQFNNIGLDLAMSTAYPNMNAYISIPPLVGTNNSKHDSTANKS